MHPPAAHVSLQIAPTSHWNVQPPPVHELAHVEPPAQSNTHPPPAHEPSHVEPAAQCTTHRPPAHVGEHVEPARQVMAQLPPGHEGAQSAVHEQPAPAVACAAHAGSDGPSAGASILEPSSPPSLGEQSARTPGSSSATVH
jgi:hypothetical protein